MRLLPIIILSLLASCIDAPEFPDTPKIKFNQIIFKDLSNGSDSLIVSIDFEDGDGDLGLSGDETAPPYNQRIYFSNKTGRELPVPTNRITETELEAFADELMTFADRATVDTLPPYSGDAICLNWDTSIELEIPVTLNDGRDVIAQFESDTIYFKTNPRHFNFLVDYYINRGAGFELFDWKLEIDCSTDFNGRFPKLNFEEEDKAIEGTIRYGMPSVGFLPLFGDELLKLEVTIIDRAGNFSNTVETPPFRLSDIRL